jgi:hypothetical protein
LIVFGLVLLVVGVVTAGLSHDYGPRASLAMGLGEVVLATMLGVMGGSTATPMLGAAALAVLTVAVLTIFAVGLNRWLPRW